MTLFDHLGGVWHKIRRAGAVCGCITDMLIGMMFVVVGGMGLLNPGSTPWLFVALGVIAGGLVILFYSVRWMQSWFEMAE